MGDLGGEGFTKLDLAKEAVLGSLDEFQPKDEVGLWVFSTFLDGERDYLELVPPGPLRDTRGAIEQSVRGLIADGGTGLYDSTAATVQAVRDGLEPSKINAVVLLSDGMCEDDPPGCELEPLLEFLGSTERETVRSFQSPTVGCRRRSTPGDRRRHVGSPLPGHRPAHHRARLPVGHLELLSERLSTVFRNDPRVRRGGSWPRPPSRPPAWSPGQRWPPSGC